MGQEHRTPRHAIVIVFDRLGSGFLGPYGNTWVETPSWNRLASQSLLFETVIADSPRLDRIYRSYWTGVHAAHPELPVDHPSLLERLERQGVESLILTDDRQVAEHPLGRGFAEYVESGPDGAAAAGGSAAGGLPSAAPTVEETRTARLLATGLDRLTMNPAPRLLWLHAAALNAAWDAPYAFREALADDEDPPPPNLVAPPDMQLEASVDPDLLLGLSQACAGEVAAIDVLLGALLDALEDGSLAENTLLIVTSPRGFPLGEHGSVGPTGDHLHAEVLETPLLIRTPETIRESLRLQQLVQPGDLYTTLLDWFAEAAEAEATPADAPDVTPAEPQRSLLHAALDPPWKRGLAIACDGRETAIRTPIWFLRHGEDAQDQLYVKPDDRWEVNEVADRCRDVVEQLESVKTQALQALQAGKPLATAAIPEHLLHELD